MYVSYLTYPPPAGCPRTYVESRAHASNLFIANEAPNVYIIEPQNGVVLGSITTLSLTDIYRLLKNSQL